MEKSFTSNYLKIYFWQGLSIIIGFLSFFIVIPALTNIPGIYGIYMICVSLNIFLSYSDLGFIPSGLKYASENMVQNNHEEEIRIIGFTSFILFIFLIPYIIIIVILSYRPEFLIKSLSVHNQIAIASHLLLILAFSSPIIILQRIVQVIFSIRLEEFIYKKVSILANLTNIASVFYFFGHNEYNIVGYYFFIQFTNLIAVIISLLIVKNRYKYDLMNFLNSVKFSRRIFNKLKGIAFSSLYGSLAGILYYELDIVLIAKLLGSEKVALYAVPLTLFNFFRNIFGIIYSPFAVRFNHFVGLKDFAGLKIFYYHVIIITLPIILFPTVTVLMLMKPIILSLVGTNYSISVRIGIILIMIYSISYISYPASILLSATERLKMINITNTLNVAVFWLGIYLTFSSLGLISFAIFKFIAFMISGFFYCIISMNFLKLNLSGFVKKIFGPAFASVFFLIVSISLIYQWLPLSKSKFNLMIVISWGGLFIAISIYIYYICSSFFKNYIDITVKKYLKINPLNRASYENIAN